MADIGFSADVAGMAWFLSIVLPGKAPGLRLHAAPALFEAEGDVVSEEDEEVTDCCYD